MKCAICGISVESIDEAIDQDWISYFYEGDEQHGPVCSDCSGGLLQAGEDGEREVKKKYRGKIINQDELEEEAEEYQGMGVLFN